MLHYLLLFRIVVRQEQHINKCIQTLHILHAYTRIRHLIVKTCPDIIDKIILTKNTVPEVYSNMPVLIGIKKILATEKCDN